MAFLGLYSCMENEKNDHSERITFDQTTNWVILNKSDAIKQENTYAWEWNLKHPADYIVQVVFDTEPIQSTIGEIKLDGQEIQDVFEKDYKLLSLEEVEQHIKEKGHLPNIPSAKEVKKNGFSLGEMNRKLLEKVEELMLYTIQQEKRIKALEDKLANKKG